MCFLKKIFCKPKRNTNDKMFSEYVTKNIKSFDNPYEIIEIQHLRDSIYTVDARNPRDFFAFTFQTAMLARAVSRIRINKQAIDVWLAGSAECEDPNHIVIAIHDLIKQATREQTKCHEDAKVWRIEHEKKLRQEKLKFEEERAKKAAEQAALAIKISNSKASWEEILKKSK